MKEYQSLGELLVNKFVHADLDLLNSKPILYTDVDISVVFNCHHLIVITENTNKAHKVIAIECLVHESNINSEIHVVFLKSVSIGKGASASGKYKE